MVLLVVFINAILILDSNLMRNARNTPSVGNNQKKEFLFLAIECIFY